MDFAQYIRTLHEASFWARDRILAAAEGMTEEEYARPNGFVYGSIRGILTHTLGSEVAWFSRCRGLTPGGPGAGSRIDETNLPTIEALKERWLAEAQAERAYLETLSEADLAGDLTFSRANGETVSNSLWLILTQVYGHSIQHRAEAAEALTMVGRSPGNLDLLFYMAERDA